jgi:hypothetical protein
VKEFFRSSVRLWNFEFHHPFGSERGGNDG